MSSYCDCSAGRCWASFQVGRVVAGMVQNTNDLERIHTVIRRLHKVLPERLTFFPVVYHARRHRGDLEARNRPCRIKVAQSHA